MAAEAAARKEIDAMLSAAGWHVCDASAANIHAARAGGLASFALQLAKRLGAQVITTCSAGNADRVKSLGADQAIEYNKNDFTKVVRDCDAAFDTVGGEVAKNAFKVLCRGGRAAFINGPAPTPPSADFASLKPDAMRKREHLGRIV